MGGCPIIDYVVKTDGGNGSEFAQFGSALTASTFGLEMQGLTFGLEYRIIVVARNHNGEIDSNVVKAVVADAPDTPTEAPDYYQPETNTTTIRVTFSEVNDGGSKIISY